MKIYCPKCKKDLVLNMNAIFIALHENSIDVRCKKCNTEINKEISSELSDMIADGMKVEVI